MEPIICAEIADYLTNIRNDCSLLPNTTDSPIHVVFPDKVAANMLLFEGIYRRHSLQPHIYFALKSNKSRALLKSVHGHTNYAEVASPNELLQALAVGFGGADVLASGPIKSLLYLRHCVAHDVLIAIDDPTELNGVLGVCKEMHKPTSILLRINHPGSRFGSPPNVIRTILTSQNPCDHHITIRGFSFHINNYSVEDRQVRIAEAIDLVTLAREHGHDACNMISIGGGFTVNYVAASAWQDWLERYQSGQIATFNRKDYSSMYPYYSMHSKEQFLEAVLSAPAKPSTTFAGLLRAHGIDLIIEPGRSLLDQAGITIFTVNGVKHHVSDYPIIVVDGNINHLSEQWFGSDFLVDPLLVLQAGASASQTAPVQCYIAGNLCLENDMLATRPVPFNQLPNRGDRLVYINTAGYQMDSNESEFARVPIPRKFTATKREGRWRLQPDEDA